MKCSNCGHELEPGSGFCENCGMITSLDEENGDTSVKDNQAGFSSDDFSKPTEDSVGAGESFLTADGETGFVDDAPRELEADSTEQIVPVFEYPEKEAEPQPEEYAESEGTAQAENEPEDIYIKDSRIETSEFEEEDDEYEPEERKEEVPDTGLQTDTQEAGETQAYRPALYTEDDAEAEAVSEESAESDDNEDNEDNAETSDDGLDDMYVKPSKSKRNSVIIAVLLVAIIAVTAGAAVMIKDNFSKVPVDAPTTQTQNPATEKEPATTNPTSVQPTETTAEETEKETTDEQTTEKAGQPVTEPSAERKTSEKKTTVKDETTTKRQTTTAKNTTTTKKPVTTTKNAVTTTKRNVTTTGNTVTTTKKPTTAASSTTARPQTTAAPTTTDPFGFGTDKVQKPGSYLAAGSRYTVYVSVNSLTLRSKPDSGASKVVYLSLGEDLTVYAKAQDGFVYVRSNRFGVYGWVDLRYVSKTRPVADTVVVVPGLVEPDKLYPAPKTMYVNAKIGIRLRKAPSSDAASVRSLSYGFPVKVTGYSSRNSGWVYVTDITHGVTGWTRLEWLTAKQ